MKGLTGAIPYLSELMNDADICVLTEHHLYSCELNKLRNINMEFDVYAKHCELLVDHNVHVIPGYGGVAILWRTTLSPNITHCHNFGDDRICVIKMQNASNELLFIIGVLPQKNCY
jgi:hypothetical protein